MLAEGQHRVHPLSNITEIHNWMMKTFRFYSNSRQTRRGFEIEYSTISTMPCNNDFDCMYQECHNNQCRLDSYSTDWSLCSQESPCTEGEGDCDSDLECVSSLVCGTDNCAHGPSSMDCCKIYNGNVYLYQSHMNSFYIF